MEKIIKKRYKKRPAHPFWFNDNRIEKITAMGNKTDWNLYESVLLDTNKKESCIIVGYSLFKGYKKATKEEFEAAFLNAI